MSSSLTLAWPRLIDGFAVVSADGMIADAKGTRPAAFKSVAAHYHDAFAHADVIVHGRHSHEGGHGDRHRILVTHRTEAIAPDIAREKTYLWNPAWAPFDAAWRTLAVPNGSLAVAGGTSVFGLFLAIGYDRFQLFQAPQIRLPGGRPLFPQVPTLSVEDVLARHGLRPGPRRQLAHGVTHVTWER
jgi:dihydrofolate reductase